MSRGSYYAGIMRPQRHGLPSYGRAVRADAGATPDNSGMGLAAMIWVPTLVVAAGLTVLGLPVAGIAVGGVAIVVHTLFRPHVAVYFLIAAIPLEWLVTFIPRVSTLTKLLGIFALLVTASRLITAALPTRWDRSGRWMILLILWALVSCFWGIYPIGGLLSWQSLALRWGIAVLICLQLTDTVKVRTGMLVLVLAAALASLAFVSSYDVRSAAAGKARDDLTSLVGEQGIESGSLNLQARYTAISIMCALYLALTGRGGWRRMLLLSAVPLLALAIILLKGRAVYLGLPFSLIAAVALLRGAGLGRRILLVGLIIIVGAASTLLVSELGFFGEGIRERFTSTFDEGLQSGGRLTYWQRYSMAFVKTGMRGAGWEQMSFGYLGQYGAAHNDWFSIAGELGLVGLIFFAAFHLSLYSRIRRIDHIWSKMFCLMLWLFMLFVGLTEDDYVTKFYALDAGLIIAVLRVEETKRAAEYHA